MSLTSSEGSSGTDEDPQKGICIAGEKLAELVHGREETVLGWFVSRRDVSAIPSMRDRAVSAALPVSLARLQPQAEVRSAVKTAHLSCHSHQKLVPYMLPCCAISLMVLT